MLEQDPCCNIIKCRTPRVCCYQTFFLRPARNLTPLTNRRLHAPERLAHSSCATYDTGGSAGIGRAVALGLSDNGATVTVLARRKDRLDAVVAQLHGVRLVLQSIEGPAANCRTHPCRSWQLLCSLLMLLHALGRVVMSEDSLVQGRQHRADCLCHGEAGCATDSSSCARHPHTCCPGGVDSHAGRVQEPLDMPMARTQGYGVVADLFKIDEVEGAVKEAIQKMGGLDILVNNGA
jgi:NAD(P)-dependent dehydrogenase (short-subunit alcohol dehydrogenase family)